MKVEATLEVNVQSTKRGGRSTGALDYPTMLVGPLAAVYAAMVDANTYIVASTALRATREVITVVRTRFVSAFSAQPLQANLYRNDSQRGFECHRLNSAGAYGRDNQWNTRHIDSDVLFRPEVSQPQHVNALPNSNTVFRTCHVVPVCMT